MKRDYNGVWIGIAHGNSVKILGKDGIYSGIVGLMMNLFSTKRSGQFHGVLV